MSGETRIADLETIKALANLLGEHHRADGSADCAECQSEGYSLFTYYAHLAKVVLGSGYSAPGHVAALQRSYNEAMRGSRELLARAQTAEATIAAVRREVDNPDHDRRMSLLIIGGLVCPDPPTGVWDGSTWDEGERGEAVKTAFEETLTEHRPALEALAAYDAEDQP